MPWELTGNPIPDATSFLGTLTNEPLIVKINRTERLRIDSTGNVGVGTPTPGQPLSVVGTVEVDATDANSGTTANFLQFGTKTSGEGIGSKRTGGGNQYGLDFYTAFSNRMSITNGGNVVIGTTPGPGAKLTVAGSVSVTALGTYSNIEFTGHPIEISTGYSSDDFNLFMGADRTNQLSYIQSGHHNIGKASLALNPQGGNVGIGTYKPFATLEVNGDMTIRTTHTFANSSQMTFYVRTNVPNSNLDVSTSGAGGLGPCLSLTNTGGGLNAAAAIDFYTFDPGEGVGPDHVTVPSSRIMALDDGNYGNDIVFLSNTPGPNAWVERMRMTSTGNVTVPGDILLTGGADCAEQFDVSGSEPPEPGTVVVIDEGGTLRESHNAYDKKVAGVVSGAGDYRHAILLDKRSESERRVAVALLGKVYCKVDAQYSPVEVGDLLTTSQTPGHAMKAVDPLKAFGTVLGKALRGLPSGQGLVPILVALQ